MNYYSSFFNLFVMMGVLQFYNVLFIFLFEDCSCKVISTTPSTNMTNSTFNVVAMEFNMTDIPQSDIDDALNLDVGIYTTVKFQYFNDQNKQFNDAFDEKWNAKANRCFDDYVRCLINQDDPTPVCGYNRPQDIKEYEGYRTFNSYCDAYFDNCRRGYRYWRILDTGRCDFKYRDDRDGIINTFRRLWSAVLRNKHLIEKKYRKKI